MLKYTKKYIIALLILSVSLPIVSNEIPSDEATSISIYNEGLRKYVIEDYAGSIKDFEEAYHLNKKDSRIKKMYVNALIKEGSFQYKKKNLKSAKKYYTEALDLAGDNKLLRNKLQQINHKIDELERIKKRAIEEKNKQRLIEEKNKKKTVMPDNTRRKGPNRHDSGINKEQYIIREGKLPFNIEKFIQGQNEENRKILSDIIKDQKKEREKLINNIKLLSQLQHEDRKYFGQSLMLIAGVTIAIVFFIAFIIFMFFVMMMRRRKEFSVQHLPQSEVSLEDKPAILLEYTEKIDEAEHLGDIYYSEIVNAKKLREFYLELVKGNTSWEIIKRYITELNYELKEEIIASIEKKINSGEQYGLNNTMEVLLPLVTDGNFAISKKSNNIIKRTLAGECNSKYFDDTLTMDTLLQLAKMSDIKTDRIDHSINVSEISYRIAEALDDPDIDPEEIKLLGLAHDIGYLEIDKNIILHSKKLSVQQFSIVKSHPERGFNLLENNPLPQFFLNGIKYHHERLDGSGYPEGLHGNAIPPAARIIGIADFADAVTSSRPYRKAISLSSCFSMMKELSGKYFDEKIVNLFIEIYNEIEMREKIGVK